MLKVSETARAELSKDMSVPERQGASLVLHYQGVGSHGPALNMSLEPSVDGLEPLEADGLKAYMATADLSNLMSTGDINIDYRNDEGGSGYVVSVESSGCGCGNTCDC